MTMFSDLRVIWVIRTSPGMDLDFLATTQRMTPDMTDMTVAVEE
jgi:hypothetical protein